MPPSKAKVFPPEAQRHEIIAWIRDLRKQEAKRSAGDPGPVPARRLSNAEFDYTIRDLTGVDIRPAREFPVDPANEAGFDNSAESLAVSPALLNKYLDAARKVSEHIVFAPEELTFAEFPVIADTDRDKYSVRLIMDFYKRHKTDYADFFQAAWHFENRAALGQPNATLAEIAGQEGVSAKFLTILWGVLSGPAEQNGPIAALQALWKDLPRAEAGAATGVGSASRAGPEAPLVQEADEGAETLPIPGKATPGNGPARQAGPARATFERLRDFVKNVRDKLVPQVNNLKSPGMDNGSQPLVYWKDRTMAANRLRYNGSAAKQQLEKLVPGEDTNPAANAARLALRAPEEAENAEKYEAAFTRFCAVFPDTFLVTERARVYLDPKSESKLTGRYLSRACIVRLAISAMTDRFTILF